MPIRRRGPPDHAGQNVQNWAAERTRSTLRYTEGHGPWRVLGEPLREGSGGIQAVLREARFPVSHGRRRGRLADPQERRPRDRAVPGDVREEHADVQSRVGQRRCRRRVIHRHPRAPATTEGEGRRVRQSRSTSPGPARAASSSSTQTAIRSSSTSTSERSAQGVSSIDRSTGSVKPAACSNANAKSSDGPE